MTSQNFVFPPPPPPPPSRPTATSSAAPPTSALSGYRGIGGSGARGHHGHHGRGRGNSIHRTGRFGSSCASPCLTTQDTHSYGRSQWQQAQQSFKRPNSAMSTDCGQKRQYSEAFPRRSQQGNVAPAVPSFSASLPLPSHRSPVVVKSGEERTLEKVQGSYNSLGLTPRIDAHSSDEEDEDDDDGEEVRSAAITGGDPSRGAERLVLTYKGKTFHLTSPAAISEWVSERRKNFPTNEQFLKARKRLQLAKAKQNLERARKTVRQRKSNATVARAAQAASPKRVDSSNADCEEQAQRSQQKIAKLKKKLEAEERKYDLAKSDDPPNVCDCKNLSGNPTKGTISGHAGGCVAGRGKQDPSPMDHQSKLVDNIGEGAYQNRSVPAQERKSKADLDDTTSSARLSFTDSSLTSSSSDPEDFTSSSGSSIANEDSDSEDTPQERTSRGKAQMHSSLTARQGAPGVCHKFRQDGKCPRGKGCRYTHIRGFSSSVTKKARGPIGTGRISLFQRLAEQERKHEVEKALTAPAEKGGDNNAECLGLDDRQ